MKVHKISEKLGDKELEKKLKKDNNKATSAALIQQLMEGEDEPEEPIRKRYLTNDPTVDKMGELLRDNPAGILLFTGMS